MLRAKLPQIDFPQAGSQSWCVTIVLATMVCLMGGCGAGADSPDGTGSGSDTNERAEPRTPIAAIELTRRDLSRQLTTSAAVEPRITIRLATQTSGTVERVNFEEGDRVEAGTILAHLDMSEAKAEYDRAKAVEAQARLTYERQAELLENRLISASEYDAARTELSIAESERRLWETRIAFGEIISPRAAVVTERFIEPGEAVENGEIVFELAGMDELVMRAGVSELDVVHLEAGQHVPVRLDAMPDTPLDGTIRRIFPTAERGSRLVPVEISLPPDAAERGVRPGFLGRIRIPIDERPNVLAVPSSAIGEDDDGVYVYVVNDNRLHRRTVSTGTTRGQWTEVTDGLEEGEIILATNPIDMHDGQAVRIVGWRG